MKFQVAMGSPVFILILQVCPPPFSSSLRPVITESTNFCLVISFFQTVFNIAHTKRLADFLPIPVKIWGCREPNINRRNIPVLLTEC